MTEPNDFGHIVCEVLNTLGLSVLERPQEFVGAVTDLCNPDSPEATILYLHCNDDLLRPYRDAVAVGTSEAMDHAALKAERYLHDVRRATSTDSRNVAQGIASGIMHYLLVGASQKRIDEATKRARDILLGNVVASEQEIRNALAELNALSVDSREVKVLALNLQQRLQPSSQPVPQPGPPIKRVTTHTPSRVEISFNANGGVGSVPANRTCLSGGSIVVPGPGTLTKTGYRFVGWGYAPTSMLSNRAGTAIVPSRNTTLYAVWEPEAKPAAAGNVPRSKTTQTNADQTNAANDKKERPTTVGIGCVLLFVGLILGAAWNSQSEAMREKTLGMCMFSMCLFLLGIALIVISPNKK